jgi:hypothetical protein
MVECLNQQSMHLYLIDKKSDMLLGVLVDVNREHQKMCRMSGGGQKYEFLQLQTRQ